MTAPDARELTAALGGRWHGTYGMARCLAHADRNASQSIRDGEGGRLLIKCFANCTYEAQRDALIAAGHLPDHDDAAPRPRARRAEPRIAEPDAEREARVARIVAECGPIADTPADRYLTHRAIDVRPVPDSIRWRPHAWRLGGALIALASDDDGRVRAVQQVYVNDAGHKAGLDVGKRTHGSLAGAAVRLPGAPSLILTEGVEDALTIWQSTGRQTWACLGVTNIGRAPVPVGTEVLIGRDNDPYGSPADLAIGHAVDALMARGCIVRVARPPRRFHDFNDLLLGTRANVVPLPVRGTGHAA